MDKSLNKIRQFYLSHQRMPSYKEIAELFGYRSRNSAYKLVVGLINKQAIKKDATGRLLPSPSFKPVAIVGTIEAGFPSPAEEELSDTISLDEWLIRRKEATYMLKVNGDSMVNAGIIPGDMVLVERGINPKDGAIVVAEVDNEWTLKYFRKKGTKVWLEAANPKYPNIYPRQALNISAVVRAIIRKY